MKKKLYQNKRWLIREYLENQRSPKMIAEEFNVTALAIRYYLKLHNIPLRNKTEAAQIRRDREKAEINSWEI
uniref:Uncharacterized protein n=1 Tax=viral metagenome TaxID=1070528 RepID=A0A6M3LEH1_9ZZZZ